VRLPFSFDTVYFSINMFPPCFTGVSIDQLCAHYPDLRSLRDPQELHHLLAFRNIIRIALLIIPPQGNKQLLLNIGGRLEGAGNEYITGTGQKICVTRRVAIYEQEGHVTVQKKKPKTFPSTSEPTRYQQHEYVSSNKVKKIKLDVSDIMELRKGAPSTMSSSSLTTSVLSAHANAFGIAAGKVFQNSLWPAGPTMFPNMQLPSLPMAAVNSSRDFANSIASQIRGPSGFGGGPASGFGGGPGRFIYPRPPKPPTESESAGMVGPLEGASKSQQAMDGTMKRQETLEDWQNNAPLSRSNTDRSFKSVFNSSDGTVCRKMQVYPGSSDYKDLMQMMDPIRVGLPICNDASNLIEDMTVHFGYKSKQQLE
jgi:hypothetical protein